MSRRRLLGWEPSVTVTYVFDDNGRRVGERHTTEPEFNREDRAWLEALAVYEADLCPSCRHPMTVSTDPDGPGYDVPEPVVCRACTAIHQVAEPKREAQAKSKVPAAVPLHAYRFAAHERGV